MKRLSFITQFKFEFLLPFMGCRKVLGKMPGDKGIFKCTRLKMSTLHTNFRFTNLDSPKKIKFIRELPEELQFVLIYSFETVRQDCLTVCYYHVMDTFQSESTLCSCLNVKELIACNRYNI